jgi:hypothetical protein
MTWCHICARIALDATLTLDNISATTTYVMQHEEHLWNVKCTPKSTAFNLVNTTICTLIHPTTILFVKEIDNIFLMTTIILKQYF